VPNSMIAYCGPAAVPDDLWTRWNVDPLLIALFAALALAVIQSRSSNTRAGWGAIVLMLSGVLMLRHLNETEAAERMQRGISEVIRKGDKVTYDLKPTRDDPSAVGTSEFADAVIEEMNS